MGTATTDLSDDHPDLPIAEPIFRDFGGVRSFFGQIETVETLDDNVLVRTALESEGSRRVLVIDNRASLRTALVGDILAQIGIDNGWNGLVINGCIRDSAEIADLPIGVKALASVPRRSAKNGAGERGVEVSFAGITFMPGHWLYADADGILVSPVRVH